MTVPAPPLPGAPTQTCPKCGMAVPAAAYVCAFCKKRLRTSPVTWIIAGILAFVFIAPIINSALTRPAPVPVRTAEEAARAEADQKAAAEKAKLDEAAFAKSPAGKIQQKHPDWSRKVCEAIAGKKVGVGMSAEQVRLSWGKPEKVNSTVYGRGTHEQWVYGGSQYVYFEDGVMTSLQQTK